MGSGILVISVTTNIQDIVVLKSTLNQNMKQINFKTHIESKHEGVRHTCDQCNSKYLSRSKLTRHTKSKHSESGSLFYFSLFSPPTHHWLIDHASIFLVTIFGQFSRLPTPAPSVTRDTKHISALDQSEASKQVT